jgi:hypothetical protein
MDGVAVAAGFRLRNKPDRRSMRPGSLRIGGFIAGPDDHGDLLGSGRERLFDQDVEQGFLVAIAVDEGLKRQLALRSRGGSNDSFPD